MAKIAKKTKRCPSDLTDEEWEQIAPLMPKPGRRGRPREVDFREQLRLWGTLHFFDRGSPFCCGEALCHLGLFSKRRAEVGDHVRRSMKLRHPVEIEVVTLAVCYHAGVTFSYQFIASSDDDFA
jgi:hypothetical protein